MRRIAILAAATAMLLTTSATSADAQGRGRGRGDERRAERSYDRGDRGYDRGDRGDYGYERPGNGRGFGRGAGRGQADRMPRYEPDPDVRRRNDRRNAPPPYYAGRGDPRGAGPGPQTWGRGQRLPPMYRGEVLRDPSRYRLRAAPPGYDWVGVGPDIYLMQRSTGMVLDSIPGGY